MTKEEKKVWLNRAFQLSKNQSNLDVELEEVQHYRDKCTDISVKSGDGASRSGGNSTENNFINYAAASAAYELERQIKRLEIDLGEARAKEKGFKAKIIITER